MLLGHVNACCVIYGICVNVCNQRSAWREFQAQKGGLNKEDGVREKLRSGVFILEAKSAVGGSVQGCLEHRQTCPCKDTNAPAQVENMIWNCRFFCMQEEFMLCSYIAIWHTFKNRYANYEVGGYEMYAYPWVDTPLTPASLEAKF